MHIDSLKSPLANVYLSAKCLVMVVAFVSLNACGSKEGTSETHSSQTIARVNGDEITVHQINNELQRANVKPEQKEAAAKQVVQGLIDRQIIVQEAIKAKLDRNPQVLQALENAKSQILAQAYIEEKISKTPKPTAAEVAAYRNQHPQIFANRKVYIMDEIMLPANTYSDALKTEVDAAKTMEEITALLDKRGIKYRRTQAAHAAETLPQQLLEQLGKMKVSDIIFVRAKETNLIARIQEVKDAPVAEKDSTPLIERILFGNKRKAVAELEMKNLRAAAKVVYLDKAYEPAAKGQANAAAPLEAKSAEVPVAPAATPPSANPAKPLAEHVEKGLSGL
jgi:EpsD family peptidyl-prolyl cis-trans isomerase